MTQSSQNPALIFREKPYHANERGNYLLQFRELGFTTLRDVFEPDSVDAFREQILSLVQPSPGPPGSLKVLMEDPITVLPARAPRLVDVLGGAFAPWIAAPMPVLFDASWLAKPGNPDAALVLDWHKDGDHDGLTTLRGYSPPSAVHTAIYFEDMTEDKGPTFAIPRSHRDPDISPYSGAQEVPFLPRKGDVVIWDQRLWHRASPRTATGTRLVAIFGYFGVPFCGGSVQLLPAQRKAAEAATSDAEAFLYRGPFTN